MYGKLLNTIINIMFITYLLLLVSFYFLHEGIKENINNINYSTVDTVATTGVFNVEVYNNLKEKVLNYSGQDCDYSLTIKYEQKTSPGVYNTHFIKDTISPTNLYYPEDEDVRKKVDPDRIITDTTKRQIFPMYKGDKITIYLEDQNQTLYGKLITMPFMGMLGDYTDFRIKSLKASMIGRDANKMYNGYEVIDEINDSTRVGSNGYVIKVRTEISSQLDDGFKVYNPGQKYNNSGNEKIDLVPGSSEVGNFHIFNTVNYYRVWDDINLNGALDAGDIVTFYQTTD